MTPDTQKPLISVVSPVHNAEAILEVFVNRVTSAVKEITTEYEIVLVDDGSPDRSWKVITSICAKNNRVKGIRLSRNFGQHVAINACIEYSRGDYVVNIDCDLQDNPAYIKDMFQLMDGATDYVITIRKDKSQSALRKLAGKFFYTIYNRLANSDLDENIGTFSMLSRKVVDAYLKVGDYSRFYLLTLSWLGFNRKTLFVENQERHQGQSSYSFPMLLTTAFTSIISNSEKILNLAIFLGIFYMVASVLGGFYIIIDILYFKGIYAGGWPSIFVLLLFSVGIILFCIGIAAIYIGNIFIQVKGRPRYIVEEVVNQ
jgi:dolichol-phosphate mannosyltransferase